MNKSLRQTTAAPAGPARVQLGEDLLSLAQAWLHGRREWHPKSPDLPALWNLARRHGLDGMAGSLAVAGASLPDSLREPAMQAYCTNTLRFQQALGVARKISAAAAATGIHLSFVKGPALAAGYGDEGVRAFGDLDVLVPDGEAARKLAGLCHFSIKCGAQDVPSRFWNRATDIGRVEVIGGGFQVELTFGSLPANQPLHELYQRWPDRYLRPAGSVEPFPVPDPEAHLLFLLEHLAQHWCDRVIWLADFAVLMRRGNFDAAWLEHAARQLEMRKLLRAVTGFCRCHLDESVPELGAGPTGWKDGLFLCLLSPDSFPRTALHKYGHAAGSKVKDALLGSFQHVFATDLERPAFTRRRAAPRWMGEWLQHVLFPGGSLTTKIGPVVTPVMFTAMTLLVCLLFQKSPRGLARLARRQLSEPASASRGANVKEESHVPA